MPQQRWTANTVAAAPKPANKVVTRAAPIIPNRGIITKWPVNANGSSGPVKAKVQPGLPAAVRMAVATAIMTKASAPKINTAKRGAAGEKFGPKIAPTTSGADPAARPAKGS